MSGFSSHWLALREPLDLAARNTVVEQAFFAALPTSQVHVLDLASGAGSTVAALNDKFSAPVCWKLTDFDEALLDVASSRFQGELKVQQIDLQADLEKLPFDQFDAITTSAFLDLTSKAFLERLVDKVVEARKPFLASLTYDGRAEFSPGHDLDEDLRQALNRHQQTDKGFGPALGPEAAKVAIELFKARDCRVVQGTSDWLTGADSGDFQLEFLSGWRRVGLQVGLDAERLESWWQDRQRRIGEAQLRVMVGHLDFVVLP
ncbi:class I SAM-dependent methyltransferase [uncultured Roseibium sp.]|uniref:class I SAM-dependent methyltransferase n=1 Tax=uncultured Roseibium sp. TaxID=1936171 RepID=UPI002611BCD6|nr:class I SAM-dependent methyltransferase [uncultured Roseibium sp.]